MHAKLMAVWGVRMTADGESLSDYAISYSCPDGCLRPGEGGYGGFFAGPATADSAAATDGILMRVYAQTTLYDPELYTHLMESARESVGDRGLYPIMVGRSQHSRDHEVDPTTRAAEIELLTRLSDGVYIWEYLLPLYGLAESHGIFEEPTPTPSVVGEEGVFNNDWDGVARWPYAETCIESWFQEWRFSDSGDVGQNACVTVKLQAPSDDDDGSEDEPEYSFRMVVGQADDATAFVNTEEGGVEWSDGHLVWTEQVEFDATQPITVRLENTEPCGNRLTISRFRVVHTDGDCASGLYPDGSHFDTIEYESGLEDPEILELYCELGAVTQELYGQEAWSLGGGDECGG
jgi:hypothetical protein